MSYIYKLLRFVKPYWAKSLVALILLTAVVLMDLAIPRLVEILIDQGISGQNARIVIQTSILMLLISVVQTVFAILNNNFSVQVGESVARDLREALFLKIQSFSYGNLDRLKTGQLMVRLTSDTTVYQRLVQITLRIGTRAPLLMIGSLILMFNTDQRLALTMLPLLLVTSVIIVFFIIRMEPLFMIDAAETGPAQHRSAGEHRRGAGGQSLRARRVMKTSAFEGQRGLSPAQQLG